MVYFITVTANASTRGARFVSITVFDISWVTPEIGRVNVDSTWDGVGLGAISNLVFFEAKGAMSSEEVRFFTARFAALRICLADFSSLKMGWRVLRSVLDISSRLKPLSATLYLNKSQLEKEPVLQKDMFIVLINVNVLKLLDFAQSDAERNFAIPGQETK